MTSDTLSAKPSTEISALEETGAPIRKVPVLGVSFHCLSMAETSARVEQFIAERTPRQICLSNAYIVSLAQKDQELRDILARADLVLADGMSIVWGSRWIHVSIPERVAGPDLMIELCRVASEKNYRVFLLGSSEENLDRLSHVLSNRWPSLPLVGRYSPPMCDKIQEDENKRIYSKIAESAPDILFVCMSAPKQEKWIAEHLTQLNVPACIGVGAAFDFLSGRIPRAPAWMRRIGLEWLYRLGCEPRRLWKRYLLGNVVFLSLLIEELVTYKFSRLKKIVS